MLCSSRGYTRAILLGHGEERGETLNRRLLGPALWLSLILQLALSLQPSIGLTLCVADDGHMSFELAHSEPCTRELRRHHPDRRQFEVDELAHHPCRDIPLLESRSYRTPEALPDFAPLLHRSSLLPGNVLVAPQGLRPTSIDLRPPAPASRFLRSVVLLV